jgi:DNA helicase HerA-like ATPase
LSEQFKSKDDEIAFLRSLIAQKEEEQKKSAGFNLIAKENVPKKEEQIQGILNKYKETDPENLLSKNFQMSEEHVTTLSVGLSPEEHDGKMQGLIDIFLTEGIRNTFSVLAKMNDSHLEDDFHRFLVQYILKVDTDKVNKNFGNYKETAKALETSLYQVTMPTEKEPAPGQSNLPPDPKNIIALMERFFVGMLAISDPIKPEKNKNYFTVEIAKAQNSNQIKFYVSVPNDFRDLFQKQVLALYPAAKLELQPDDYNVFLDNGFAVGAYATPSKTPALPIKTYKDFAGDSISVVLSVLSQLKDNEEGAAVQIVIRPSGEKFIKEYGKLLDKIREGKPLKRVLAEKTVVGTLKYEFFEMFKAEKSEKDHAKVSHVDEDATRLIAEKLNSTIFNTNIRVVASSRSAVRSAQILGEVSSSFRQYTESKGNAIVFKNVKPRAQHQFFKHYSYRYFDEQETFPLNAAELATVYHFPKNISDRDFSELKQYDSAQAPAPKELPKKGLYLGKNIYRHAETPIYWETEARVRHMYIIGQTGTGKSKLIQNMIDQDLKNGEGFCFIDPHGADLQEILTRIPKERIDDVIYFDPGDLERPFGLNMLEYDPTHPEQKTLVVNEMFAIFNKLFDMKVAGGPAFEQYFRNSALLVMEHPESGNTLLEVSRVLSDSEFRHMKLEHCKNPFVKQFFQNAEATSGEQGFENYVPYVTNKFDNFLSNEFMRPIIAQEKSTIDFKDIMANRKILLVNLSKGKLGELGSFLLGLIIVGKILINAFSRDPKENPPPFYLYLDEFQNVATESIKSILSEARKYKLGLVLAHQYIEQIPKDIKDAVFGNVGSKAIFRINPEDAKFCENFLSPTFTAKDVTGLSAGNCYLQMLANNVPQKPFNLYTPLLEEGSKEIRDVVKELSSLKYGTPRAEIEEMILKKFNL